MLHTFVAIFEQTLSPKENSRTATTDYLYVIKLSCNRFRT